MRSLRSCLGFSLAGLVLGVASSAQAQPAGWPQSTGLGVKNRNGAALVDQQVRLVVDTAAPITAGTLKADGGDLRFGTACDGGALLPFWIESGLGTTSTVVWVKVASLPDGMSPMFMFSGNAEATRTNDPAAVFDGDANNASAPYSATDRVSGLSTGGVSNSSRGFQFKPNEDVLLVGLGKNEPNGTARTLTLWDIAAQTKVFQQRLSASPAGEYTYESAPPSWLTTGKEYTLQIYQGGSDGYYFGLSTQMNSHLTYMGMRYCNGCDADTFPGNLFNNYHYGVPDFQFLTFKQVALPVTQVDPICPNTATCDADCSKASCGDGFTNSVAGEECDDGNTDDTDGCRSTCKTAKCGDGVVHAGVEECDDENTDDTDGCLSTCKTAKCGDGIVHLGFEGCDDGNTDDTDGCLSTCVSATCGDGKVQAGVEQCDDANTDDTDGCLTLCTIAKCGDGKVQKGIEQCDDANTDDTDACLSTCIPAKCGDGKVRKGVEQCDDGDIVDGDGCSSNCTKETPSEADAGSVSTGADAGTDGGVDPGFDAAASAATGCQAGPTGLAGNSGIALGFLGILTAVVGRRRKVT